MSGRIYRPGLSEDSRAQQRVQRPPGHQVDPRPRTAWAAMRDAKPESLIDFNEAAREWGAEWARKFGSPLASLA